MRSNIVDWKTFKELETGGIIRENLVATEGSEPKFFDNENDIYYGPYHIHPEHGPLEGSNWQGEESLQGQLYPAPNDFENPDQMFFRKMLWDLLQDTYPYYNNVDNKLPSEILAAAQMGELSPDVEAIVSPAPTYTTRNDKGVLILNEDEPDAYTSYGLGLTRVVDGAITDEILDRDFEFFEPEDAPDESDTIEDSNLFYTTAFEGDWHEIWMRRDLTPGSDGYTEIGANFECFYVEDGVYRNIPDWKTLEVMLSERGMTYDNVIRLGKREEIDQEWRRPDSSVGDYVLGSRASEWSQYTKSNAGYEPVAPFTRDPAEYAIFNDDGSFSGEFQDSVFSTGATYLEKQRVRFENQLINLNGDFANIRIMIKGKWRRLPYDGTESNDDAGLTNGSPDAKAIVEMNVADKWPDYLSYNKAYAPKGLIARSQDDGGLQDSPVFFYLNNDGQGNAPGQGDRVWNDFEHRDDALTFNEYRDYLQRYNDCWNQPHLIAAGEPAGSVKYYELTYDESDVTAPITPARLAGPMLDTEEVNTWAQGIQDYMTGGKGQLEDKYSEIEGLYSLALSVLGEDGEKINGKLKAYAEKANAKFGMKKRRKKFNYDWGPASNYRKKKRTKGSIKEVINTSWKQWSKKRWVSPKMISYSGEGKSDLKSHFKYNGGGLTQLSTVAATQMADIKYSYEAAQEVYADGLENINTWNDTFVEQYEDTINNFSDDDQVETYFSDTFESIEEIITDYVENLTSIYADMINQLRTYVDTDQEMFDEAEAHIAAFVAADGTGPGKYDGDWKNRVRFRDWWLGSGNNNPDNVDNNDDRVDLSTVSRPQLGSKLQQVYKDLQNKIDNQG